MYSASVGASGCWWRRHSSGIISYVRIYTSLKTESPLRDKMFIGVAKEGRDAGSADAPRRLKYQAELLGLRVLDSGILDSHFRFTHFAPKCTTKCHFHTKKCPKDGLSRSPNLALFSIPYLRMKLRLCTITAKFLATANKISADKLFQMAGATCVC